METVLLGRTGIEVSAAGLGCGGFSRLGLSKGLDHAASIVRAAYEAGVTFFDTAAVYGTQPAVEQGLRGIGRGEYVISTKFSYRNKNGRVTAEQMLSSLEQSLRELGTDYIDVFSIHALMAEDYPWARDYLLPALTREKEQGKIRSIGVTEMFGADTGHTMFQTVLPEDLFDVIMVGYNLLNPSAAERVLPLAMQNNVGVLCMFAVRHALWDREQLETDLNSILAAGQGGEGLDKHSLDFITEEKIAATLTEAAYRFCRYTPGITVTLTGTGDPAHLAENLRSLAMPPLPETALARLKALFGKSDCVSGQ
jgi:aryl-alcohol dehydrogenase-like predicted oxidoreductase